MFRWAIIFAVIALIASLFGLVVLQDYRKILLLFLLVILSDSCACWFLSRGKYSSA